MSLLRLFQSVMGHFLFKLYNLSPFPPLLSFSSSSSLKNVLGYFQDYIPQVLLLLLCFFEDFFSLQSYVSSMSSGGSNVQKEVVHWARFETEGRHYFIYYCSLFFSIYRVFYERRFVSTAAGFIDWSLLWSCLMDDNS